MLAHAETAALRRALEIAADPAVPLGPNPRVGCVLLDAHGAVIAEGHHRRAGTPHAEIDALSRASVSVAGATALVTLEPCAHHGRTGPCADALLEAGVARVVVARRDPNPHATGGVETLRAAGIDVELDVPEDLAAAAGLLNRGWEHGLQHDRPLVTAKTALTLDGRVAAADGSSRWITGEEARSEVHDLRATCDVVLIGAGTARIDHPSLTARRPDGTLLPHQPLRVVMGTGDIPPLPAPAGAGDTLLLRTHDPSAALAELFAHGRRHVLLEGGPTVTGAFLRAGLVDELIVHLAPTLLGAGPPGVGDLGITTISERLDLDLVEVAPRGCDLRLTLRPRTA
ncbi:bifunctional diaminohydroxyphosphoribosylaminopyrimidine deaminase/5-amino-6-(5-phosphoribosylamino)uracil reductase RibD [Brachybacterium sp. JB7]|uniref:bifunctional diaminohydroxyphosphoribosylaminopyrimidine deaminase/5-amino-6-(5-phosphoribosylamino)uracil reductase RibD n=1 Tax=Brachybacterium sp. JB7 TaxID=2024478 RepID=UPI000DF3397D|nr:bifunctional diaminohydroxyphosphoribosylaminopyrimidine deaminase/5-amino-6-(5-phosphoribosylamino)uracil reductase RibD [Brachybacterium sp. JB7]RCS66117.1 bifunctional diaminohydroxyphosphoribosylaminopyrimidine deaminase/5-amino-6-(5-phosphoribosylamino)uracil reductase RibD [Brachybacterium sp. JB7]